MNFIDPNKQYLLMLPVWNTLAVKLWRRPENCAANKMPDDFLDEFNPDQSKPPTCELKMQANK